MAPRWLPRGKPETTSKRKSMLPSGGLPITTRTLIFGSRDGIQPGNTDRNYVLRRILRRAVKYGRTLGFHEPFFYKLVHVLALTMGDVFPEICARNGQVQETIRIEEEAFN